MNDDLQSALTTNFNDLAAWFKATASATGDFVAREAPLFVHEYLAWAFWSNILRAAPVVCIITLLLFALRWCKQNKAKFDVGDSPPYVLVVCALWVTIMFCAFLTLIPISDALKVKIAPRVVLVEKAAELARFRR